MSLWLFCNLHHYIDVTGEWQRHVSFRAFFEKNDTRYHGGKQSHVSFRAFLGQNDTRYHGGKQRHVSFRAFFEQNDTRYHGEKVAWKLREMKLKAAAKKVEGRICFNA